MVLEAGVDRAGEDGDVVGAASRGREQRLEPARPHLDVVVDEADERRVGGLQRGVARRVEAPRSVVGEVARAVARGGGAGGRVGPVVDHEHLGAGGPRLRDDRGQRDLQIGGAALGGDGDGGLHGMRTLALPRPWSSSCTTATASRAARSARSRTSAGCCASTWAKRSSCSNATAPRWDARARPWRCCAAGCSPTTWRPRCAARARARVSAHNVNPAFGWRALAAARAAGARVVLHLHNYRLVCAVGTCFNSRGEDCVRCQGAQHAARRAPELPRHRRRGRGLRRLAGPVAAAPGGPGRRGRGARRASPRSACASCARRWSRRASTWCPTSCAPSPSARARRPASTRSSPRGSRPRRASTLAVQACARAGVPLVVAGDGPQAAALRAAGGARFVGRVVGAGAGRPARPRRAGDRALALGRDLRPGGGGGDGRRRPRRGQRDRRAARARRPRRAGRAGRRRGARRRGARRASATRRPVPRGLRRIRELASPDAAAALLRSIY